MQDRSDWLPAYKNEPVSLHAKAASEPGSPETRMDSVSSEPGSPHATY
jgi:hypothetical protein